MGKDKKQKREHKDSTEQEGNSVSVCYGPALPPKTTSPATRDCWMSEDNNPVFDTMTYSKDDIKKVKEKEKTPEYDYSAPGLHIMSKSSIISTKQGSSNSNRLFSKQSHHYRDDNDAKSNVERMKARFKMSNKNRDLFFDDEQAKDKKSKFKTPYSDCRDTCPGSNEGYNYYKKHRKRSSSQSPKRYNRSRSRSPKRECVQRDRSRSPIKYQSGHKIGRRKSKDCKVQSKDCKVQSKECKVQGTADKQQEAENTESVKKVNDDKIITDDDLNKLSARIVKAEIMANNEKVCKLKKKLDELKKLQCNQNLKSSVNQETVILTSVDTKGNIRPINAEDAARPQDRKRRKEKMMNTHSSSGLRDKYFPDDNNKELSDLLREEKSLNKLGQDEVFLKYAGKLSKMSQDRQNWTLDDMFESNIAKVKSKSSKDIDKIVSENIKEHKRLESCHMCLEKCSKDSIVHIGKTLYVRVPLNKSLTRNHCQIIPITHIVSTINGDEDFWDELSTIKSILTKKFSHHKLDVVFMELAQRLGNRKHIFIDCIPVPMEESAMLPAYFKKAILECDVEWSQNKKLVDTREKGLKRSIPQGLPYFSVEFGIDGGYAHVIEDERLFKRYFGLEIVAGILDSDINLWRHPEKESDEGLKYKKQNFEKLSVEF